LFGNECSGGHHNLKRYQIVFNPHEFKNYFKFTVVRNPYDRLVSAFWFLKRGGLNQTDKEWGIRNLSEYDSFDAFVKKWVNPKNIRSALHFHPQLDFICLKKNQPGVDFLGYYENIETDFSYICQKLEIRSNLIENNRNAARTRDYRECYTDESRKIAADAYADDIRVLGYTFDNADFQPRLAKRGADGRVCV
jgi:hypothetical protein